MKNFDNLVNIITLQLNPDGKCEKNLILLIRKLNDSASKQDVCRYRQIESALIRHAQFLLKEEWEKVKNEASPLGKILKLITGTNAEIKYGQMILDKKEFLE